MKPIDDNRPAFPKEGNYQRILPDGNGSMDPQHGMSLLEWYAGMALQGELANATPDYNWVENIDGLADRCFIIAAAMIKRSKK